VWSFIGSECVFFASLISTFIVYKSRSLSGPGPEILNIPLTSFSTFILLMSSLLMVLALAATQRGDQRWARIWLGGTISFPVSTTFNGPVVLASATTLNNTNTPKRALRRT
jgi:heme/copper-type cytochrome/quinol oxidase subunit 3